MRKFMTFVGNAASRLLGKFDGVKGEIKAAPEKAPSSSYPALMFKVCLNG
jgi:hypothetical protein